MSIWFWLFISLHIWGVLTMTLIYWYLGAFNGKSKFGETLFSLVLLVFWELNLIVIPIMFIKN